MARNEQPVARSDETEFMVPMALYRIDEQGVAHSSAVLYPLQDAMQDGWFEGGSAH